MAEQEKSFEESLKELEAIVAHLEEGDIPLEKALEEFQRGVKISRNVKQQLKDADELLIKIVNEDGLEEPHDLEEG